MRSASPRSGRPMRSMASLIPPRTDAWSGVRRRAPPIPPCCPASPSGAVPDRYSSSTPRKASCVPPASARIISSTPLSSAMLSAISSMERAIWLTLVVMPSARHSSISRRRSGRPASSVAALPAMNSTQSASALK